MALRFEDADTDELRRRIDDALMDLHFLRGLICDRPYHVARVTAAIETLKVGAPGIEAADVAAGLATWKAEHPNKGDGQVTLAAIQDGRITQAGPPPKPSRGALQCLVDASPTLPAVVQRLGAPRPGRKPVHGEIWRVGRNEAALVWVRRVLDEATVDVIPVVLDVELADAESVIVPADATCLEVELVAMTALRTHVHVGALLGYIDTLDINCDVLEVMNATKHGRQPRAHVGPPIVDGRDQRIEYRCAIRDVLAELAPSAWVAGNRAGERA